MKHHPVVIITSHPAGMAQAIKKLEQDGFEVKVLDSLSANLIDFFGAISQSDPEMFGAVSDNHEDTEGEDPAEPDPNEETDGAPDEEITPPADGEPAVEPTDGETAEPASEVIFSGTINDETVEIHEVDGSEIILHPVSVEGSGSKVKFNLSESIEMTLWESKEEGSEEPSEVEVHLVIPDLNVDATVKIKISEMTMNPPVILMGKEWYAASQSTSVEETT